MNTHKNARMTIHGRALLVKRIEDEDWPVAEAARSAGISPRTAYKWLARHRAGGERMLHDRSSAPAHCPHRLAAETVAGIERLRRQRLSGPQIARHLSLPRSTVGAVLRRLGLGRLAALDAKPPVIRYEGRLPANSSTSTPRSSAGSTASATASPATAAARRKASAGTWSMSASMTPPGSPIPRSCPTRRRKAPVPSSSGRWPSSPAMASPSSG